MSYSVDAILRFENPADNAIRLDIMDPAGWQTGKGLDLGRSIITGRVLAQPPFDGELPVGQYRPNVEMRIPVYLAPQDTWAEIKALYDALATELDRAANQLRFRPRADAGDYLFDTFRADIPSMFRGQQAHPALLGSDAEPMELIIRRKPIVRGAGSFV